MNRRELFIRMGELVLVLPAASMLGACGTKEDTGTTSGDLTATSTSSGHTHSFTIPAAKLATPPAAGYAAADSTGGGHTHTVTLTQANLTSIAAGGSVTVTSSSDPGHTHSYTFIKS